MSFKIERPGLYRQRDGGKAEVFAERDDRWYGMDSEGEADSWTANGSWLECDDSEELEHTTDIVAIWHDAPEPGDGWRVLEDDEPIADGDEIYVRTPELWDGMARNCALVGMTPTKANNEFPIAVNRPMVFRRRIPKPFRISDHGPGVYECRDGRQATVTGDGLPWWRGDVGTAKGYCWTDTGTEREGIQTLELVRFIGPLPDETPWTPTYELRWRQLPFGESCEGDVYVFIDETRGNATRLLVRRPCILEQRWTRGTESDWRAVEVTP